MIRPGALGAFAQLPFRLIDDTTGLPASSYAFAAGDVKALIAGAWVNVGAQVVELGGAGLGNGGYAAELTAVQSAAAAAAGSKVHYYLAVAGFTESDQFRWEDIETAPPTAAVIRDAILDTVLDTGRTIRGWFRRKYALDFGRVTGMVGNLRTTTAYKSDGVTAEFAATQDMLGGTRASAGSE